MAVTLGGYVPNKQQSVVVEDGDLLIVPTYGLAVDLLVVHSGALPVTAVEVTRYPTMDEADPATSKGISVAPGGVEDTQGYVTRLQALDNQWKDLPCAAGQDAWGLKPTGSPVTVHWTLRRTKVEDPLQNR